MTGWGAEQLSRKQLLNLSGKLYRAQDACIRQANKAVDASQMDRSFVTGAEMCQLWGEAADELITRGPGQFVSPEMAAAVGQLQAAWDAQAAEAADAGAGREPEAGS